MVAITVIWSQNPLHEFQMNEIIPKKAIVIYINNLETIILAKNPIFQKQFKHIVIKYYYNRDFITEVEAEYNLE